MNNYYLRTANDFGWGPAHSMSEAKIAELLPFVVGAKILDIGCGPGSFVDALSSRGFDAVGIDKTAKFIAFARKNFKGKFLVADALNLPFEAKSFDTVFVRSVLEHLDNDLKALKEACRVGKRVVVIVPQETPKNLLKRGLIYSHYRDLSHLRYYTVADLAKLAESAKATLVSTQFSEPLPDKSVVFELLSGPKFYRRILVKLLFALSRPARYYLEIIAIIKP